MNRLDFQPARHGFHFRNLFVNHVTPQITTYGLCGGMSLAASRYWLSRTPIPTHREEDFSDGSPAGTPPPGSPLQRYIYDCQMASYGPLGVLSAANWVVLPGPDDIWERQFAWSVSEFEGVRRKVDAGLPVVLGLRRRQLNEPFGHQVLAYGYDETSSEIFVYDPNYPDVEQRLRLDIPARRIVYSAPSSPEWSSYFDTGCPIEGERPAYFDLGLQAGISVQPPDAVPVGSPLAIDVSVRNFGFRPAHIQQLYVYVRGPRGENLDAYLGGDNDASPIPSGGERRLRKQCQAFGAAAGNHVIGVSYLSVQGHWIQVPPIAGGTRNEVTVRATAPSLPQPATPWHWHSGGGVLGSPPVVGLNANGSAIVFARGLDNRVWLVSWELDRFGGWEPLGGDQTFTGSLAVIRNHWDKLELFARGRDAGLWHRWQNAPNANNAAEWSPWQNLNGQLGGDPSVALNHDGRIEVLAVHGDGRVWHIYQRWFDAFGAPWSGWEALGTRRFRDRVALERDGTGCLVAIARSRDDDSLWRCRQTSPSGPWTDWEQTGAMGSGASLGRNADGRLEAFVRGLDGRIWHSWQSAPGGAFGGWEVLHERAPRVPVLDLNGSPTAWNQPDGSLAMVAAEGDGEVFHIGRINMDPWWTDFAVIGNDVFSEISAVSSGRAGLICALGSGRDLLWAVRLT